MATPPPLSTARLADLSLPPWRLATAGVVSASLLPRAFTRCCRGCPRKSVVCCLCTAGENGALLLVEFQFGFGSGIVTWVVRV
eukprot:8425673-Pyramimonas_sp.AAC.1